MVKTFVYKLEHISDNAIDESPINSLRKIKYIV